MADLIPERPDLSPSRRSSKPPPATWKPVEVIPVFFLAIGFATALSIPAVFLDCSASFAVFLFAGELGFAGAVLFWVRLVNKGPIDALGLPRRPWVDIGIGLAVGAGLVVVVGIWGAFVSEIAKLILGHEPRTPEQVDICVRGASLVATGVGVVLMAPIGEELFFRGFLYKGLRRSFSVIVALPISAIAFSLVHYQPPLDAAALLIFSLLPVGAGLAAVYEWRQSLLASVAAHAMFNLIGFILIISSR